MKKIYLSLLLLCFAVIKLLAVEVAVTMNATSPTMSLIKKGGPEVAIGEPESRVYTFEADPGIYILTGYSTEGGSTGTIELTIENTTETVEIKIVTVSAWVTNTNADKTLWVVGTDYTIPENEITAASREGVKRKITTGQRMVSNNVQTTFHMLTGDTYTVYYYPTEVHSEYLATYRAATMTGQTGNANQALVVALEYTITVPKEATLYVGSKTLTHYVPFKEVQPKSKKDEGEKSIYTYLLASGTATYNYRVKMNGAMTHAGKFGYSNTYPKYNFEITKEEMLEHGDVNFFDHNVRNNSYGNVSDVYLNINERGHFRLGVSNQFQIVNQRVWQLIDDQSNNYFVEPDYQYTVLDENFQESSSVVTVDATGKLTALARGTAIVQVRYNALYAYEYNRVDAFSNWGKDQNFWFGSRWSCIWPENVGTFVVTVGENEDLSLTPNFKINSELPDRLTQNSRIDSELDILYYFENQPGYEYSFKPEGAIKVEVANPVVDTVLNTLSYPDGFSDRNVTQENGTYKLLLTHGRNIIRVTSAAGSAYQVLSAKPMGYVVENYSRPNDVNVYPGDTVNVQFHGLYHPALKLSGIYNQSAYIYYNNAPNGTSLILSPNQYIFAGHPDAQSYKMIIPTTWDKENYSLEKGSLYVKGYGSVAGKHRAIDRIAGVNPNFTASVTTEYWGAIPNVSIPLQTLTDGVKFEGVPEGSSISVTNLRGDTILPDALGVYYGGPRDYTYEIYAHNRKAALGSFTITQGEGVRTIPVSLEEILLTDNSWDGVSISLPEKVTAEESSIEKGEFEGMEGYYKIKNGYELAWLSYFVNKLTNNSAANAILIREIDLKNFNWTPIGNISKAYSGVLDGGENTIKDLYINTATTYQALLGYINGATVKNLTVKGKVTTTGNYSAGVIAYSAGASIIANCRNEVVVSGKQYTAGILGYATNAALIIDNCYNMTAVTATGTYLGGIVGNIVTGTTATLNKVANYGKIVGSGNYTGGISGSSAAAQITNAINIGDVSGGSNYVGGVSGSITAAGKIENALNGGVITASSTTKPGAIKGVSVDSLINTYSLAGDYQDTPSIKTTEEFTSGEIAWLLGNAFGQKIGIDICPVFDGQRVYKVTYVNNRDSETGSLYTNGVLPKMGKNGYEGTWYDSEDGLIISKISEDSQLYVKYVDDVMPTIPTRLLATANQHNIVVAWTASTDNVGVIGYNIYLDGEFKGTTTETSYNITGLQAATKYLIAVEAYDAAENVSLWASITKSTIDATAPTTPADLSGVPTETTIALSWTPSTDNIAVAGYNVYVGGVLKKSVTSTSYTLSGLTLATEYEIEVEAYDIESNKSDKAYLKISTVDLTAPTAPANLIGIVDETSISLSWTASTDNVGVAGYNVYINGTLQESVSIATCEIDGLQPSISYFIEIEAVDAVGNKSAKTNLTEKTIDSTAPSTPADLSGVPTGTTIQLSWSGSTDNVGVEEYHIYVDDELDGTTPATSYMVKRLSSGVEYKIEVIAYDAAGNVSEKTLLNISTLDNVAPSIPRGLEVEPGETSVTVSWIASTDNVGVVGYKIYVNDDFVANVWERTYSISDLTILTEYKIGVEAIDAAGNKSERAEMNIVTIDETAPTMPSQLAGIADEASIELNWAASTDNVSVTGYNIYLNGVFVHSVAELSYILTELDEDTDCTIEIVAVDAAANESGKVSIVVKTLKGDTSVDEWDKATLEIYPNPFVDYIIMEISEYQQMSMFNLSGQLVLQRELQIGINRIDTKELPRGTYIIKCESGVFQVIK